MALESQQLHGDDRRGLLSSEKSPNVIVGRCLWLWLLFFWYCYVFVDVLVVDADVDDDGDEL